MGRALYPAMLACELLRGLDIERIDEWLEKTGAQTEAHPKAAIMRREGDAATDWGIVLSGIAYTAGYNGRGDRRISEILMPGDLFGNILHLPKGEAHWSTNLVARTDCVLLRLENQTLHVGGAFCGEHAQALRENLLAYLCGRMGSMEAMMRCLRTKTIRGRISCFFLIELEKQGGSVLTLPLNRDELADYLAIPRPSLSRELSAMRRDGLIDFQRKRILLRNTDALRAMV